MTPAKRPFRAARPPRLTVTGCEDRTTPSGTGLRSELVVIDPRVVDGQFLLRDLLVHAGDRRFDVVTLSTEADGIRQITELLRGRAGVDAIHIVSHGDRDGLWLGAGQVGAAEAAAAADWKPALAPGADVLVYGCDVAAGAGGRRLLRGLRAATGADVAASDDRTGRGGDWSFEYRDGVVDTSTAFSSIAQKSYRGSLATFVVTSSANSGTGTLRNAIESANAVAGPHAIAFAIPTSDPGYDKSTGVFTIRLTAALPTITQPVTIDGSTQAGNIGNTNPGLFGSSGMVGLGPDGVAGTADDVFSEPVERPEIQIVDGANLASGLRLGADSITVRGLAVSGFGNSVGSGSDGDVVIVNARFAVLDGNVIGSSAANFADPGPAARSGGWGVYATGSPGGRLINNVIGFTNGSGVYITGSSHDWVVANNEIRDAGMHASGFYDSIELVGGSRAAVVEGNRLINPGAVGVELLGAGAGQLIQNNTIVGAGRLGVELWGIRSNTSDHVIRFNVITGSAGAGIALTNGGGVVISRNSIIDNGGPGIDLANDGVTLNDLNDADSGPNSRKNFPIITRVIVDGSTVTIWGDYNSVANTNYNLEFFASGTADPTGYGEGDRFLGSTTVATDAAGNASFVVAFNTPVSAGEVVTATSTDLNLRSTSEFGPAVVAFRPGFVVTPTTGLVTTEAGGQDAFTVALTSRPTANVTIPVSSSNTAEGRPSVLTLTFTTDNWNLPQTVTVSGVNDFVADGDAHYTIVLGPAASADPGYAGRDADDVSLANSDDDVAGFTVDSPGQIAISASGEPATVFLSLTSEPTGPVAVLIVSADPSVVTTDRLVIEFIGSGWRSREALQIRAADVRTGDAISRIEFVVTSADPTYNGRRSTVTVMTSPAAAPPEGVPARPAVPPIGPPANPGPPDRGNPLALIRPGNPDFLDPGAVPMPSTEARVSGERLVGRPANDGLSLPSGGGGNEGDNDAVLALAGATPPSTTPQAPIGDAPPQPVETRFQPRAGAAFVGMPRGTSFSGVYSTSASPGSEDAGPAGGGFEEERVARAASVQVTLGTVVIASAGAVLWSLRGAAWLVSATLSAAPAWTVLDPISLLQARGRRRGRSDDAGESLADLTELRLS